MGGKVTKKDIIGASGPGFLFNDLSIRLFRENKGEPLDGLFKELFAFIFNSVLSGDKKQLINIRMDEIWIREELFDSVIMTHGVYNGYNTYEISYNLIRCEVWWNISMADKYTALFAAGFAAYALKNDIEIQNPSFTDDSKCYDYFPAVAWLHENRDSEDYDYIFSKLYDYVMANNCLDKLLDFYDGLGDMEGKAEFMHYCGERGMFEREEMRL